MTHQISADKNVGRLVGVLLLLHLAGGLILPYVLLDAAVGWSSFLAGAAAHGAALRTVVALFILAAGLVLAIAVVAGPTLQARAPRLGAAFLAVAAANLALQLVESGLLLTALSVSQQFSTATASDAAPLQAVGAAVGAARRWAHYTQLLTVVGWLFLLYLIVWRAALAPRLIAAAGLLTTVLQIIGVPGRGLLGLAPITELAMPLAPVHLTFSLWLMAKGFAAAGSRARED